MNRKIELNDAVQSQSQEIGHSEFLSLIEIVFKNVLSWDEKYSDKNSIIRTLGYCPPRNSETVELACGNLIPKSCHSQKETPIPRDGPS
jgi:hypothetical protein